MEPTTTTHFGADVISDLAAELEAESRETCRRAAQHSARNTTGTNAEPATAGDPIPASPASTRDNAPRRTARTPVGPGTMRIGRRVIPLTAVEIEALTARLEAHVAEHGTAYGFASALLWPCVIGPWPVSRFSPAFAPFTYYEVSEPRAATVTAPPAPATEPTFTYTAPGVDILPGFSTWPSRIPGQTLATPDADNEQED